jgi:hypothetical protein
MCKRSCRQNEAPSSQIAQSCKIGHDLDTELTLPDQNIASLPLPTTPSPHCRAAAIAARRSAAMSAARSARRAWGRLLASAIV